jgi:serine/threonine-protein kinase
MMSPANWTTRFSAEGERAQAGDDSQDEPSQRTVPESFVGSRVGAYLITKRLGAGGVGEVFKAEDVMLKREVAIKVLRRELARDPLFLERFRQEAQLHAKLSHPNVASVHAFLHEGDMQFLVMEYVAGISLDEFIRSGGPVPVERALSIFRRALDGIEHAHHSGIVHRDIKPANIMLADNGQVKVMDFGIARALDSQEHLTRLGQVAGTAKSMSPEQIRGAQADVRSDIYSLGIVLYTLLSGRAPFEGATDLELMRAQVEQAPPPLRGLVKNLPASVEAVVMRALEKDPAARFQTVAEFSRALGGSPADVTTTPRPVTEPLDFAAPRTVLNPALHDAHLSARTVVNPALQDAPPAAGGQPRPAAQSKTAPRRAPMAIAALAALGLLVGGAALLWPRFAQRESATLEPAQPVAVSPPAGPQVAPAPIERTVAAQVPAPPVSEPAPAAVTPATLPPPIATAPVMLRSLSIVLLASDGKADAAAGATHRFKPGERVKLLVTTSHDAHVYCYLQDETRRIQRFYPNRFSKSALVKTDAPLQIPGKMGFEIVANARNVAETVSCFASEQDIIAKLPAAVVGTDFSSLQATSLDQVRSAFAPVAGETLAEASFRVDFK